jgi:Rieske Fe-S protein
MTLLAGSPTPGPLWFFGTFAGSSSERETVMTNQPTRAGQAAGSSRRAVLAIGATATAGALAGCTVYGREEPGAPVATGGGGGAGDGSAAVVARTGDVPAGGGLIVPDRQVVLTQPASGRFRGFSAVCTHQGCTVASVSDGAINCPCHGSRFSIEDGSVVQAATGLTPDQQRPLPEVAISVTGDTITLR